MTPTAETATEKHTPEVEPSAEVHVALTSWQPPRPYHPSVARDARDAGGFPRFYLDPSEQPAGFGQCDAMAAFNLYPSTSGSELDGIGSSDI